MLEKRTAENLLSQLSVAEILRLVLELADPVHTLVGLKQGRQLLLDRCCHGLTKQMGYSQAFAADRLSDHILQIGVPRGDDALMGQVLQDLAQNEDWLRRQHRDALCLPLKFRLRGGVTGPVAEQLENDLLLLQTS